MTEIRDSAATERNRKRYGQSSGYPCLVCGKPCKDDGKAVWVYLHDGGGTIVTADEYEARNAAGHDDEQLGAYPIGPDCYRKHKAVLAPYVQRIG